MSEQAGTRGPVVETTRLELRPFCDDDVADLYDLFADADVRHYLLDGEIMPREWVEAEVQSSAERFDEGSAGLWTLRRRGAAELVGFVGFRPFFDPPELQLIYGLAPSQWGLGLATEAAQAAVDYALTNLDHSEVRAAVDAPNEASIAVLTRLGMEEVRRTDDGVYGTVFFRLRA